MNRILIFIIITSLHILVVLGTKLHEEISLNNDHLKTKLSIKINTKTSSDIKNLNSFKSFSASLNDSFSGEEYAKELNLNGEGSSIDDLYDTIDEGLTFPNMYQKFGIQGVVKAKLYFDKQGKFVMKSSLFDAKNGFLRYHVMTYLEKKLANYSLKSKTNGGLISANFVFKYKITSLKLNSFKIVDSFTFERVGFRAETKFANALLETGKTLVSFLNLLKYRPDFLKTNKELQREQKELRLLEQIRNHPYFS